MLPRNGNEWLHSGAVFYRLCERAGKEGDASTAANDNMLRPVRYNCRQAYNKTLTLLDATPISLKIQG